MRPAYVGERTERTVVLIVSTFVVFAFFFFLLFFFLNIYICIHNFFETKKYLLYLFINIARIRMIFCSLHEFPLSYRSYIDRKGGYCLEGYGRRALEEKIE